MTPGSPTAIAAPAKLNLLLDVLGRREDGFHEIDTLMVALELADQLEVGIDPQGVPGEVRLELTGPHASADVPSDGTNLAVRAAAGAAARIAALRGGPPAALSLCLSKEIPSRAGLGGGSSDAAAALRAVYLALGAELDPPWCGAFLASLGSDCPFFELARESGAARCSGRGERVHPLPPPGRDWWIALVTPREASPTAAVYGALERNLRPPPEAPTVRELLRMRASQARAFLCNQLESAALAVTPGLRGWRDALDASGAAHFRMAGSGSSFFGLFDHADEARAALEGVLAEASRRGLAFRGRWVTRIRGQDSQLARGGA